MEPGRIRHGMIVIGLAAIVVTGCNSGGNKSSSQTSTSAPSTAASGTTVAGVTTTSTATTRGSASTTAGVTTRAATATTTSSAGANPCVLVTQAEAQALAGVTLQAGVLISGSSPTCTYTGLPTGPTAQVEIFVGEGAKNFYDVDRALTHAFTPVPGIGDEAYLEEFTLFFRKGATWVSIHLVRNEDPGPYNAPITALAKTAAGRL